LSTENEYYRPWFTSAFGLQVNSAEITRFGTTKTPVIERFDRKCERIVQVLRLPMAGCCKALSMFGRRELRLKAGQEGQTF